MTERREVDRGRDPVSARLLELLYLSRKRKRWTVRDLAEAAGVSPSYISLIENGHKVPDPATMQRIGEALEIDPNLLHAWVTVQSKGTDVASSIDAAYRLMESLEGYHPDAIAAMAAPARRSPRYSETALASAPAPELPLPARYVLGVVLAEEGREPTAEEIRDADRRIWIDRRALPERDALRGTFAWRVTRASLGRLGRTYRQGDLIVIAPELWDPGAIHPRQVFAVRHEGGVVLSRIAWADGRLVLLAPESQPGLVSVLEAKNEAALRKLVVGRVIAAVQRFR